MINQCKLLKELKEANFAGLKNKLRTGTFVYLGKIQYYTLRVESITF